MKQLIPLLIILFVFLFVSCKGDQEKENFPPIPEEEEISVEYASGLSIRDFGTYKILIVEKPWPEAEKGFTYLLAEENAEVPSDLKYDQRVEIPVKKMIVTSTTHIPSLETLKEEGALVGFPGLDYISSEKTRQLIAEGKIKEIGKNEALNTETIIDLQPDVVVGFSVDGNNKSFNTVQKIGIPVVFNADWTENSPLGKAEWIKFFGAFFGKTEEATAFFEEVENNYLEAKDLATQASREPTVLAGAMYKDQWFLPAGESWQAQFIQDANASYLFGKTEGTGSLSLSFEAVLAEAANADYWVGPAQFTSYAELSSASPHYEQFSAFKERDIFTFSSEKGETGGVIFYELAPNRPDLVLKDLISIFHPQLLPDYETTFYKPLE